MTFLNLFDYVRQLSDFGSFLEGLANCSLIVIAVLARRNWTYKTVNLSIGSFKVRRKDYNVQNITNLVSLHFYGGGLVPDTIRREILQKTSPKVKGVNKTAVNDDASDAE